MQWAALTKEGPHADAEGVADRLLEECRGHAAAGAVDTLVANAVLAMGRSAPEKNPLLGERSVPLRSPSGTAPGSRPRTGVLASSAVD
jgi:hypothetical protein